MSNRTPVTAKTAHFAFYDIETLKDVFTLCVYSEKTHSVAVFYLVEEGSPAAAPIDKARATEAILRENPALMEGGRTPGIDFFDLSTWYANDALARFFGLSDAGSVNDPTDHGSYSPSYRPVCDTDDDYDPLMAHPYFTGYNSFNYDTVMLAVYFMDAFSYESIERKYGEQPGTRFTPPKTRELRAHNDRLFSEDFKSYMPRYLTNGEAAQGKSWDSVPHRIRQAMIHSGRHLDAARLNEVQQRVGLKRLLGGQGRQIKESDRLGSDGAELTGLEDLYELFAYNVSDCVGLAKLFRHNVYSSGFDLKKGLLDEYPETVYTKKRGAYEPDVDPRRVRRDRLTPDSTSAKFVATILSPYGNLDDYPAVSYMYPHPDVAAELGVTPVNVLDQCRDFFHEHITDEYAREQFQHVYDYYKSIEGKNFNDSEEYAGTFGPTPVFSLGKGANPVPKLPNNIPYFDAQGRPTTCFATFSTGGIHGAEADHGLFEVELQEWEESEQLMESVKLHFPDPLVLRQAKQGLVLPSGEIVEWKGLITSKSRVMDLKVMSEEIQAVIAGLGDSGRVEDSDDPAVAEAKRRLVAGAVESVYTAHPGIGYRAPKPRPVLFEKKTDGSTKLKTKYAYTSAAAAIHEDFTSYYPNMLRNMRAFFNKELGSDRYAKILADKDRYQDLKKEAAARGDHVEAERYNTLRNGTKLILNSASGAGDTQHKTPIRVNNKIISMRILGQLFSWRIGQAQTLAGARIISTNTDGLYSVLDEETNNRVLAEQQAMINVEIEPEPLLIVTKDSNNRLELLPPHKDGDDWEMLASGGTLACHKEPRPDKSLAHPAVLDWALARYLKACLGEEVPEWAVDGVSLEEPLDRAFGRRLLQEAARGEDPVLAARLFQNVISASAGMFTFPFASDPIDVVAGEDPDTIRNPRALQHYNRVFFVHPGKPGAVSLRAAGAWKVNPASALKRQTDGLMPTVTDPVALAICEANGFARDRATAAATGKGLLPFDQDVVVRKISRIEPSWNALIVNDDLHCMGEQALRDLLGCLDMEVYVGMLADTFEKNWMNAHGNQTVADAEGDEED